MRLCPPISVAQRLGLIGPTVGTAASHALLEAQLPATWGAQAIYDNHELLMFHGQRVCHYRNPTCSRCVLVDLCDFYRANQGE